MSINSCYSDIANQMLNDLVKSCLRNHYCKLSLTHVLILLTTERAEKIHHLDMQCQEQKDSVLRNSDAEGKQFSTRKPKPRAFSRSIHSQYSASIIKGDVFISYLLKTKPYFTV